MILNLKQYQKDAIKNLEDFLVYLDNGFSLSEAYKNLCEQNDMQAKPPYQNTIKKVPQVCFKIPTGGGKTLIAAASLKTLCTHIKKNNLNKFVVWLVPSEAILTQTYKNLKNSQHPYRELINTDFDNKVKTCNKEELLNAADFSPQSAETRLSIAVLSYDSFRKKNKEGYKAFQENGNLDKFTPCMKDDDILDGAEENALIQVIRHYNPIIIVDESHHTKTELSREMLINFNPCFILELTATPREDANIIYYAASAQLKKDCMVKLPVIVYNRHTQDEVISDAVLFRNNLEKYAQDENIRPIVLFQAESKGNEERATFDKIKEKLINNYKIPADEIAIKTAEINELKNIDLTAKSCKIKYIITINALKEGWDCPFAYILASLANRSSAVDVEQIVGRILRRPFTKNFSEKLLNMSYVFTSSDDFQATLDNIVKGLNFSGFSEHDYRAVDENIKDYINQKIKKNNDTTLDLFNANPAVSAVTPEHKPEFKYEKIEKIENKEFADNSSNENYEKINDNKLENLELKNIEYLNSAAKVLYDEYDEKNFINGTGIYKKIRSQEERKRMLEFPMKQEFRDDAEKVILPQFFSKEQGGLFRDETYIKIDKVMLCEGVSLSDKDTEIDFSQVDYQVAAVDTFGNDEHPRYKYLAENDLRDFLQYFNEKTIEKKKEICSKTIAKEIKRTKNIPSEQAIENYVKRVVDNFDMERIYDAIKDTGAYARCIERKINNLMSVYAKKIFNEKIYSNQIFMRPYFKLPAEITPLKYTQNIANSLYTAEEDDMNEFERNAAMRIASLDNILWWHRNRSQKHNGFYINGFVNHYPDFIVKTKSGVILIVETKGDDRDNTDSKLKLELGREWANLAGADKYKYFMVFDKNDNLNGSLKLNSFIDIIKNL